MSQRLVRKLQQSLQPTLDDEEDASVHDTVYTKPASRKKKNKKPDQATLDSDAVAGTCVPPPVAGACDDGPKKQQLEDGPLPSSEVQKAKKAKKAEARKRRQEKELEEDRLLDERTAVVGEALGDGDGDDARHGESGGQSLQGTIRSLVGVLSRCDASQLNARNERIRFFGIESVEDVGDGHRRSVAAGAAAGGATANGLLPMRPPGFALPKFRDGLFVTPNRHCWPVFSTLGVALREARSEKQRRRRVFEVDWSDKEFSDAQRNFDAAVAAMADVNQMMERCFAKYPYHIPTLLQLHQTFGIMGDAPNSQLMLDMAMYAVGVLLSRFPIKESVAERVLPFSNGANRLVFEVLKSGVQLALKRGCNRTAFSLHRLLLSLDDSDPCGALLSWDYLAVRAREWGALLHAHALMEASWALDFAEQSASADATAPPPATPVEGVEQSALTKLVRAARALPGFHFNAGLAKFLTEEAEEQRRISSSSAAAKTPSTPVVQTEDTVDARLMLAKALLRFPVVAWKLVEKVELDVNTTTDPGWGLLTDLKRDVVSSTAAPVADHICTLFVERSGELFKTKEASRLLLTSAAKAVPSDSASSPLDMFELRLQRDAFAAEPALRRYRATTLDDVVGERVTRIPQELLNPGANPDEVQRDARQHELEHLLAQGYPQTELDALDRFAAVFGPLPVEVPLEQRFAMYDEMLEEYRQRIGNETNPVALFLQTLLPWNNLRDMALERAMQDRGVDDPVRQRLAQQQIRNEGVWREAAAAAQAAEDDASSSEDDGW